MNNVVKGLLVVAAVGATAAFAYKKYQEWKVRDQIITADDLEEILKPIKDEEAKYIPEEGTRKVKKGTDINSPYALGQFINMEMAELKETSDEGQIVRMLFNHAFEPGKGGDRTLASSLMDNRAGFFGPDSKWADTVTWGDLILHYARKLDYHLDEGVGHWVRYILDHLDITPYIDNDLLFLIFDRLSDHTYVNEYSGLSGLFGLDDDGCQYVEGHLDMTMDHKATFEMEFNGFLNMLDETDEDEEE